MRPAATWLRARGAVLVALLAAPWGARGEKGVIGIDVGSDTSIVAIARRGGVDIVANAVSRRLTPTAVAYGGQRRLFGETALSQVATNAANTVRDIKSLLREASSDTSRTSAAAATPGHVVRVQHRGKALELDALTVLTAYLAHLLQLARADHGSPLAEACLAVPPRLPARARATLAAAADAAGLRPLRLIDEDLAVALALALSRGDGAACAPSSGAGAHCVALVDAGHAGVRVAIVRIGAGADGATEVSLLSRAAAEGAGGRAITEALGAHVADAFRAEHGVDPCAQPRVAERLRRACARAKHTLSANEQTTVTVDAISADVDGSALITRAQLEQLAAPALARVSAACERALASARLGPTDVHDVELVGCVSRMPAMAATVASAFGRQPGALRHSLNDAEAVSRGTALAGAAASSAFRTRPIRLVDATLLGRRFCLEWQGAAAAGGGAADAPGSSCSRAAGARGAGARGAGMRGVIGSLELPAEAEGAYAAATVELPGAAEALLGAAAGGGSGAAGQPALRCALRWLPAETAPSAAEASDSAPSAGVRAAAEQRTSPARAAADADQAAADDEVVEFELVYPTPAASDRAADAASQAVLTPPSPQPAAAAAAAPDAKGSSAVAGESPAAAAGAPHAPPAHAGAPAAPPAAESASVRVRVAVDTSGLLQVLGAELAWHAPRAAPEHAVPPPPAPGAAAPGTAAESGAAESGAESGASATSAVPAEAEGAEQSEAPPAPSPPEPTPEQQPPPQRRLVSLELRLGARTADLGASAAERARAVEARMAEEDREVDRALEARNSLDGFVIATRAELEAAEEGAQGEPQAGAHAAAAPSRAHTERALALLAAADRWLDKTGARADALPASAYESKLAELRRDLGALLGGDGSSSEQPPPSAEATPPTPVT